MGITGRRGTGSRSRRTSRHDRGQQADGTAKVNTEKIKSKNAKNAQEGIICWTGLNYEWRKGMTEKIMQGAKEKKRKK